MQLRGLLNRLRVVATRWQRGCNERARFPVTPGLITLFRQTGFSTMRKTLFSVLSLLVFFGPTRPGFLFTAADFAASSSSVEASERGATKPAGGRLRARIAEARRALEELPASSTDRVALAVGDADGSDVETLDLSKEDFLRKDAVVSAVSSSGAGPRGQLVRPNE